jgi:hypothetical protein
MADRPKRRGWRALVASTLIVHVALLVWGARRQSPTLDEPAHLVAGISHWRFGTFDLYRVNPPLVRALAAIPVLFADHAEDWHHYDPTPGSRSEVSIGNAFAAANRARFLFLHIAARWGCIPLSLVGAYVCYRWARELYGEPAGIVAMGLWCFDPNILAHGQLITPDVGAAALGVAASYAFWRWLREPTWMQTLIAGTMLGIAELTKTTLLVFFALWPVVWLAWRWPARRALAPGEWKKQSLQVPAMLLLGLYLINCGYGFEGSLQKLGEYHFVSNALGGPAPTSGVPGQRGNRFSGTCAGSFPVPLPANYVMGVDMQMAEFDRAQPSFLRGEWRRGGWWYYYLYALGVKLPLGTWVLVLLAIGATLCHRRYSASWRDELALLAPILAILILVSSQTGMNHHMRYVLPVFPFAFVWMSKAARAVEFRHWPVATIAGLALAWSVVSSLGVYPHSLSYFNELAGGPRGGHYHLHNSNIDWGQDLLYLKEWYDDHPEIRPLQTAYFGSLDPEIAGIDSSNVPRAPGGRPYLPSERTGPIPGWYALSVNEIHRRTGEYEYFLRFEPAAMAGYSIYIYHITLEEVNRVRRDLGLPELDAAAAAPSRGPRSNNLFPAHGVLNMPGLTGGCTCNYLPVSQAYVPASVIQRIADLGPE